MADHLVERSGVPHHRSQTITDLQRRLRAVQAARRERNRPGPLGEFGGVLGRTGPTSGPALSEEYLMTTALRTLAARLRGRTAAAAATAPPRTPAFLAVPLGSASALTLGGTTTGSEDKRKVYAS
ncbi:albusnodin family lasso peptide [Yinghuangia aomiensis]